MKTIEEKAKRYDEALEKAKNYHSPETVCNVRIAMENLFPELKESEDEKIRKEMIFYFTEEIPQCSIQEHSDKMRVFISWLKKQEVERTKLELKAGSSYFCYKSRYERADNETFKKGLIYKCNKDGVLDNFVIKNPEQHFIEIKDERIAWLEKQGDQKTDDRVESKFHEGEWINNGDYTWKIVEVKPLDYILQSQDGNIVDDTISHVDEQFHSFTIQDAKDGDVLYENDTKTILIFKSQTCGWIKVYCDFWINKNKFTGTDLADYGRVSEMDLKPATKEQCDLLFQKMHEAGYEWDVGKKELKKIEKKPANNIEPIFNVGDKIQYLKGCGTIMTIEKIENGEYIFANNMGHTTIEDGNKWYLVEQKPAWSEEDDEHLERILKELENQRQRPLNSPYLDKIESDYNWLKSLKDRVQPKQEWSDEDKYNHNIILSLLNNECVGSADKRIAIGWLKSLKYRVQPQFKKEWSEEDKRKIDRIYSVLWQAADTHAFSTTCRLIGDKECVELQDFLKSLRPQNTWKPSDEQMLAINTSINVVGKGTISGKYLIELQEQLKKLREE